jgi:hypothetical protein
MVRVLTRQEIIDDGWHPLSGQPAPEYVPPYWIGPHVGVRLVEAMRTLRSLPLNGYPHGFVNAWPAILVEYSDRAQYEDDPVWKAEQAAEANRIRTRASSVEIARMEIAIAWPARYLHETPQLLRTVGACAVAKSRHRPLIPTFKRADR